MPAAAARRSRLGGVSLLRSKAQALSIAARWRAAAESSVGRQRLHGRKPAASAAAASAKKRTFSRRGRREAQPGRQNTPVVVTPYKKRPSAPASRATTAAQQASRSNIVFSSIRPAAEDGGERVLSLSEACFFIPAARPTPRDAV